MLPTLEEYVSKHSPHKPASLKIVKVSDGSPWPDMDD
jgi:hypothetical protein